MPAAARVRSICFGVWAGVLDRGQSRVSRERDAKPPKREAERSGSSFVVLHTSFSNIQRMHAFFSFVLFHALEGLKIADYPATANLDEEVFVVRLGVELLAHLALGLG